MSGVNLPCAQSFFTCFYNHRFLPWYLLPWCTPPGPATMALHIFPPQVCRGSWSRTASYPKHLQGLFLIWFSWALLGMSGVSLPCALSIFITDPNTRFLPWYLLPWCTQPGPATTPSTGLPGSRSRIGFRLKNFCRWEKQKNRDGDSFSKGLTLI